MDYEREHEPGEKHHHEHEQDQEQYKKFIMKNGCPVSVREDILVTVPVVVRTHTKVEEVELKCLECHVVKNGRPHGRPNAVSRFTITQKMQVTIPLKFIAETDVGEGHVEFDLHECNKRE